MLEELAKFCLDEAGFKKLHNGECAESDIWRFVEDYKTRSRFSYFLLQQGTIGSPDGTSEPVPRRIIQFWDTEDIPQDVRASMESWQSESEFEYILFDDRSARAFIAAHYDDQHCLAFDHCHHPAMRADYFRLAYLLQNGGWYVDADDERCPGVQISTLIPEHTMLGLSPLVWEQQTEKKGRLVPGQEYKGKEFAECFKYYFNNAPIACTPHNPIIRVAFNRATRFVLEFRRKGERGNIHFHTGPENLTTSLFYFVLDSICTRAIIPMVQIIADWQGTARTKHFEYKKDERNWRTNAILPART